MESAGPAKDVCCSPLCKAIAGVLRACLKVSCLVACNSRGFAKANQMIFYRASGRCEQRRSSGLRASTGDPWKGSPSSDVPGNVIAKASHAASARSIDRNEAAIAHKGPGAGVKNHDSL